jgi:hypothetical protein
VVVRGESRSSPRTRTRRSPPYTATDGVNATPNLILLACAAGAVAVPIQTAPLQQDHRTPPATRSRSGAAATPADHAGDPGVFAEQGHRRRPTTSRSCSTAQPIHSTHHSSGTSRRDNSSTTTGDHAGMTTRPSPRMPRPDRRTDPPICPGRQIWMTYSAPAGVPVAQRVSGDALTVLHIVVTDWPA